MARRGSITYGILVQHAYLNLCIYYYYFSNEKSVIK